MVTVGQQIAVYSSLDTKKDGCVRVVFVLPKKGSRLITNVYLEKVSVRPSSLALKSPLPR